MNRKILSPKKYKADVKADDNKTVMIINHKLPLAKTLNALLLCSLQVGQMADFSQLRLLNVIDKDNNVHANISYHPYTILKPSKKNKHQSMAKNAQKDDKLVDKTIENEDGKPLASVFFGQRNNVENVCRKFTRLYDSKLEKNMLVKPSSVDILANDINQKLNIKKMTL